MYIVVRFIMILLLLTACRSRMSEVSSENSNTVLISGDSPAGKFEVMRSSKPSNIEIHWKNIGSIKMSLNEWKNGAEKSLHLDKMNTLMKKIKRRFRLSSG